MNDQPNPRMIMRGGMMLPEDMVRSNTPFIPTREQQNQTATSAKVGAKPLSQRMSEAYDRMKNNEKKESNKISRKDTVLLGKLVLEIEQVKNNLNSIENEFRSTFRKKAELDKKENELLKEEKERLTILGASFRGFRRRIGAITALLAGKQFLEGDLQGGFQNTAIALTSFLPDIIRIVSGVVLGRMLLGGRGMGAARGVATGGGRGGLLPMLLAGGGLLTAGTALGSRGSGDQRRMELTRRQAIPQLLSRNDVRRFRASSARFDSILSGMDDKKDLDINTRTALEVGDKIKEPKGFVETAKDYGGKVTNFFKGDNPIDMTEKALEQYGYNKDDFKLVPQPDGTFKVLPNTDGTESSSNNIEEDTIENIDPKEKNTVPEGAFGIGSKKTDDFTENEKSRNFADIFGKDKLINLLPYDEIGIVNNNNFFTTEGDEIGIVNSNNILTTEGGESKNNIITIGSEDKQVSTGNDTPTTNSNVHVKSTFSDNSKISYILEYGAGAVV